MRLKLELLGQREGLIEELEEALLVGALVKVIDAATETAHTGLARLDDVLGRRSVHHQRALDAVVIAAVDTLQQRVNAK